MAEDVGTQQQALVVSEQRNPVGTGGAGAANDVTQP